MMIVLIVIVMIVILIKIFLNKLFQKKVTKKQVKPKRPCCFCGAFMSKLPRHITSVHKDVPEVKEALLLTNKCRVAKFDAFK